MTGTLSDKEIEFLKTVHRRGGTDDPVRPKQPDPLLPAFQRLVDLGYMRVVRLMCGIFRQPTGEVCFKLTEAGVIALGFDPEPGPPPEGERPGLDM